MLVISHSIFSLDYQSGFSLISYQTRLWCANSPPFKVQTCCSLIKYSMTWSWLTLYCYPVNEDRFMDSRLSLPEANNELFGLANIESRIVVLPLFRLLISLLYSDSFYQSFVHNNGIDKFKACWSCVWLHIIKWLWIFHVILGYFTQSSLNANLTKSSWEIFQVYKPRGNMLWP